MADQKLTDQNVSQIDKAIAAAQARKAAKNGGAPGEPKAAKEPRLPSEPKRPRLTEEEKAAKLAQRETERNERKANREAARTAKLAERSASRQPAHMRKVQKAAEKLSTLGQSALLLFNEATTNLSAAELSTLALHIQHFNRVSATQRALSQKIEAGNTVNIVGGDPRFIGKTGTVTKAQRIRCYVKVEGFAKDVYLFTSDVTPAELATAEAVPTAEAASA